MGKGGVAGVLAAGVLVAACGHATLRRERSSATRTAGPPAGREDPDERTGEAASSLGGAPGALIRMEMSARVGVLLDEIPKGPARDAAAAQAIFAGGDFWRARAARQTRLTYYRLMFRQWFHPDADPPKGPLPLPADQDQWEIHLTGVPHREKKDGHDAVVVDYHFQAHLLTDKASPGAVEPKLGHIGGTWKEPFHLPLDPDLLFERTGHACMDEAEYPPFSVFEENTHYFYDDTCEVEDPASPACHVTAFPSESCVEALEEHTGEVKAKMRYLRLPYLPWLADAVRTGTVTDPDGADLAVLSSDMARENRIVYRFFSPGSCELEEGVIGQLGWRRLLTFSASVRNDGAEDLHVGDLTDPDSPWLKSHVYELSDCHHHYHFSHYGTFAYGGAQGSKRAFCLEDTNRYRNDEQTPLVPGHQSCDYQGVSAGWGDEYQLGIPGQWVDITGIDTTTAKPLTFESNPDHFLCEGTPVLDADGQPIFDPTPFVDPDGNTVSRERCDLPAGWQDNNHGEVMVGSPGGSFVTEPCTRGEIGPLRSCGFDLAATLHTCAAGSPVTLHCTGAGGMQVARVCERSEVLGVGVACTVGDSVANAIVKAGGTDVTFTCPAVRDSASPGTGGYSLYRAPLLPSQGAGQIACTGG